MLTSPHNELLKRARSLTTRKGRERAGQFLVEGPRALETALAAGARLAAVLATPAVDEAWLAPFAAAGARVEQVAEELLLEMTETVTPAGCVGLAHSPERPTSEAWPPLVVVLDDVRDPGNVGTILRTAHATGGGVVLCGGCADPLSPKVVRASVGAVLGVPWWRTSLAEARGRLARDGRTVVRLDTAADVSLYDEPLPWPLAVLVGNEAHGLAPGWDEVGLSRRVPMRPEADSLNVAISAAVTVYEVVRQHGLTTG